jgi:hypothetical protein
MPGRRRKTKRVWPSCTSGSATVVRGSSVAGGAKRSQASGGSKMLATIDAEIVSPICAGSKPFSLAASARRSTRAPFPPAFAVRGACAEGAAPSPAARPNRQVGSRRRETGGTCKAEGAGGGRDEP